MSKLIKAQIKSNEMIGEGIYKLTIKSPEISADAMPGQFVNIKCCDGLNALLRRPISICNVDKNANEADIVYQVRGTGTEYLSGKKAGDTVDVLGPLGKGFDISSKYKKVAVVGGGIGIFPLLFLLHRLKANEKQAFLGFRNKSLAVLLNEFSAASDKLLISTDDGSFGYKGLITDLLLQEVLNGKFDIIYTCGPVPMIKKVIEIAEKYDIKCQVSLEQRMGCGIGACLVCACKTKKGSEDWDYSHVCKDGPVFWSNEIILD